MSDRIEDGLSRAGGSRALPPRFRTRLERALLDPDAAVEASRWRIDGPRPMPREADARLYRAITRRRRPLWMIRGVAAATIVILAASSVLVVARTGARDVPPSIAAPGLGERPPRPTLPSPSPKPRPKGSLRAFDSAGAFLAYVRSQGEQLVGPYGLEGYGYGVGWADAAPTTDAAVGGNAGSAPLMPGSAPVPAPARGRVSGQSFSATNVQEEGVDEPDRVKTDGRRLAVLSSERLWLLDVTDDRTRLRGSLAMPNATGMFLIDDRMVVFSSIWDDGRAKRAHAVPGRLWTKVTVVNIARAADPEIVTSLELEGGYIGARMVDGVVRLILRSEGLGPAPASTPQRWTDDTYELMTEANKRIVQRSSVGDWVPHFILEQRGRRTQTGHLHGWDKVSRPPERAGLGMVTVLTLDPSDPRPDNAESVIGSGDIVYASPTSLYVTSGRFDDFIALRAGRSPRNPITRIHRFDIRDPQRARYVGSGWVPGYLLNQFSLSEHGGYLRAASTLQVFDTGDSESVVTILRQRGGALAQIGSVGDLGRGERIYAVRFIGDRGYVVTFRQVDPLYVIDLRKPAAPKVLGELKIPGYSAYLHPMDDDLLLGVGNNADESGRRGGIQFSMFDVSDASDPRRLHARVVGEYGETTVEQDHLSFLYWAPEQLVVVPAHLYDPDEGNVEFSGVLALDADRRDGFSRATRITHRDQVGADRYDASISRALVVGNRLLTVSDAGLMVNDLDALEQRAWIAFAR